MIPVVIHVAGQGHRAGRMARRASCVYGAWAIPILCQDVLQSEDSDCVRLDAMRLSLSLSLCSVWRRMQAVAGMGEEKEAREEVGPATDHEPSRLEIC